MSNIPPHSYDAERAILCACLIDPRAYDRVADLVTADCFYDRRHRLLFQAMAVLAADATPIDILTVSDHLAHNGSPSFEDVDVLLADLLTEVATSAHADVHAKIVADKRALRRLIEVGQGMTADAYGASAPADIIDQGMSNLIDIQGNNSVGPMSLASVIPGVINDIDRNQASGGLITGVASGFSRLDWLTSGFQPGDLVVLAARPSMGKTALALDFARQAARKTHVLFFSLEMASRAIALRILASEAHVNVHRLRIGKIGDNDMRRISDAVAAIDKLNLSIDDTGSLGLTELRARARRLAQQSGLGLIIVDYLQLMRPPSAHSREQEVAQLSRGLKTLARELELPVIALSQLSRAVENRGGDKRPQLADLRDSGAIEQDADVVAFIWRPAQYKSGSEGDGEPVDQTTELLVRKQRNGPTGTVKLVFIPESARFESLDAQIDPDALPVMETDTVPF